MVRLIDADELLQIWKGCTINGSIEPIIESRPTIDAEPIRHAVLLNPEPFGECSRCGYLIDERSGFNYCPNCGAKIDGAERKESYIRDEIVQNWIPCSAMLPADLEPVTVTWINRDPEPYYMDIKDRPFTAMAVYYKGTWYWWSVICVDMLSEYGRNEVDEVDDRIGIVAWMPLPMPYEVKHESN